MAETVTRVQHKPVWVDLSSKDAAASRAFYARVFGWDIEVSPDPQYGGYGRAKLGGKDVAGIGPTMSPEAPTAWMVYIGTDDAEGLAKRVQDAGGTVVMKPFDVGDQGRMAVFQDPAGAFISAWQTQTMGGFEAQGPGTFGWPELSSRAIDRAIPFYGSVFGWGHTTTPMGDGGPPYTEFKLGNESVAGAMAMDPMVPAEVPSYWLVYFGVADVDATFTSALGAGAREMLAPRDFPGGRFAILSDPQGAAFGILRMAAR